MKTRIDYDNTTQLFDIHLSELTPGEMDSIRILLITLQQSAGHLSNIDTTGLCLEKIITLMSRKADGVQ